MRRSGNPIWVVRAGASGEGHDLFLRGCVGFVEPRLGDLRTLAANPGAFVEAYRGAYPERTAGAWRNWGKEGYELVHKVKVDDLVIYPPKPQLDKNVHIGYVQTEYNYDGDAELQFCHLLKVEWRKSFPRAGLSPGARKRLNVPLALYKVRDEYAGEFDSMLGDVVESAPDGAGDTTRPDPGMLAPRGTAVVDELEADTRAHILGTLERELDAGEMEEFVAHLLKLAGYSVSVSPQGPDRGVDVLAEREDFGAKVVLKVQVKDTQLPISDSVVSAFYGKVRSHEFGLFVTLGSFTAQARNEASKNPNLKLMAGSALADAVVRCYERLDARYTRLLRLWRLYVRERCPDCKD